ncbi:MAG: thiamine pyrophosphate-dependent dehydrogenase E1 component subunit alpha, partial [Promethearchaeota archaeon]
ISVAFLGDGAVCQGMFHESLNLASIWNLPVLFVCENNQWAISTPYLVTSPVTNVADRAVAYGMKGMICNGNDVLDVYQTASKAIDFIRTKKKPILLEAKTYRLAAHFEGDIESYKSEEEQEAWEKKDPISQFEKRLLKKKILTGEILRNLHQEIKAHVKDAVDFAIQSPYPPPKLAFKHVFHEERKD